METHANVIHAEYGNCKVLKRVEFSLFLSNKKQNSLAMAIESMLFSLFYIFEQSADSSLTNYNHDLIKCHFRKVIKMYKNEQNEQ